VKIFTKKNAFVGYLALKAISRKRKGMIPGRQKRNGWKLPVLIALGIVSAGVLVALVALMRRQREPEQIEGYVVAGGPEHIDATSLAEPEPSPAA
jgi:hypothetical protein